MKSGGEKQPSLYGPDLAAIYHERWEDFARELWPLALGQVRRRAPGAGTWLDLCCGTGRTLREALRAGYAATGVDLSPHQLTHAKTNASRAELVAADVRKLALGRRFDVISCFYDSFNYLIRKADLLAAFRGARRHLAAGGVFIFDMNTVEGLRNNWNQTICMRGRGYTAIVEYTYDEDENLGSGRFEGFVRDGGDGLYRRYDELHHERGYDAAEVEALLMRAGFGKPGKLDAYYGTRPAKGSEKILYVCSEKK